MRRFLTVLTLALASMGAFWAGPAAAAICPTTSNTNTDCGFILTINPDLSISSAAVSGANPYDGSDDVLVGVVNDASSTFSNAIFLSGSGNGGGLFAFDGDGICTFTNASYCSSASTGYEGPTTTFSNIDPSATSGDVNFTGGLAAGATAYFSLESSPSSITTGGGITVGGGGGSTGGTSVPEPAAFAVLGSGLLGLLLTRRRARA